jgi:hypothetical protein
VIPADERLEEQDADAPPDGLEWTVHLMAASPGKAAATVLLCLAAVGLAFLASGSPVFTLLVGVSLFTSLADYFLPVRYRLTPKGAETRHFWPIASIEWKQVRRRLMSNDGLKLSPLKRQGRLEAYRGVFLRFGDQDPERVLEVVRRLHDRYG